MRHRYCIEFKSIGRRSETRHDTDRSVTRGGAAGRGAPRAPDAWRAAGGILRARSGAVLSDVGRQGRTRPGITPSRASRTDSPESSGPACSGTSSIWTASRPRGTARALIRQPASHLTVPADGTVRPERPCHQGGVLQGWGPRAAYSASGGRSTGPLDHSGEGAIVMTDSCAG